MARSKKILVVEDEETLAEAISFLLSKEGFDVAVASLGNGCGIIR